MNHTTAQSERLTADSIVGERHFRADAAMPIRFHWLPTWSAKAKCSAKRSLLRQYATVRPHVMMSTKAMEISCGY